MTTKLLHAGVGASSLESADRFYADLLGLCRSKAKELSAEQCRMLFGVDSSMLMAHYRGPGADLEVFADSESWLKFLNKEGHILKYLITRKIKIKGSPKLMKQFASCFPG